MYFYVLIGLTFWKSPRRKTYAVSRKGIEDSKPVSRKRHHSIIIDSDEDDDFCKPKLKESGNVEKKLNMLMCDVGELKSAVSDILTLSKETKIPLELHRN